MPLRPCLELGCPNLVDRGRCADHAALVAARRAARKSVYDDPRWDKTRKRAIARAGGRCQALENGRRCSCRKRLHGHHAYPGGVERILAEGLNPFDERWVVVLCGKHHGQHEARLRRIRR